MSMLDHTLKSDVMARRLEVITDTGRRRWFSKDDKARIVEESLRGHRQGSATARRHGISRSLLTRWRTEYRAGLVGAGEPMFTPLALALPAPASAPAAASASETKVEIVLANGRRVVVAASIDPAALARLLPVLEGA